MSLGDPVGLIQKYRKKGLLLDSNLLLLLLVGSFNSELIGNFKRTRASGFTVKDFELLKSIISRFEKILTTPHILTEVSNLSTFSGMMQTDYFKHFGFCILNFDEKAVPSMEFCQKDNFSKFGITDAAISHLARNHYLVLTADFPLSNYLQSNKIDAINFNHLRPLNWL